jgi:hypothetical protein
VTWAEIVVVLAALFGLYRILRPLQARLEKILRAFLDPRRRNIIEAEADVEGPKPRKERGHGRSND